MFFFCFSGKIVVEDVKIRFEQMVLETGIKINSKIISAFCNFEKKGKLFFWTNVNFEFQ